MTGESIRLVIIRQVIDRIEAVLIWAPDPVLLREAKGRLHLSWHLVDIADGRYILHDGPRAATGLGPAHNLAVLPLHIPTETGKYQFRIEPVVENRFWASARGYQPLALDAERIPDGSVRIYCAANNRHYAFNREPARAFSIDSPLYGLDESEICVAIPWALSRFRAESYVLDVGSLHDEPRYLRARAALKIPFLATLNSPVAPRSRVPWAPGDPLPFPFRPGAFDLILAISVLAEAGPDRFVNGFPAHSSVESEGLEAAANLAALLRPGGRLIVTLPFGRFEDHGDFIQYDLPRVQALAEAAGYPLTSAEYYAYGPAGWSGPVDPATLGDVPYRAGFHAGAVACLEVNRPHEWAAEGHERTCREAPPVRREPESASLSAALSPQTIGILKLSGVWSKMRGETDRMRPIMLVCETVNHCNSDCVFCPYSSQTRARGVMEMELFEQVVSQYSQIGGGNLSLTPTVGEALLDGMWMRRIHTLAAWQDRIAPSVTTNLYALDRYPDEEVRAMLSVLRRIHISCYGMTAGECETITRHPHLLDRFLAQTRRLLSLREASGLNCEVVIGFRLLQPRTEEEVCAFLREEFDLVPPHGATTTYANKNNFAQNALPGEAQWFPDHANSSTCSVLTMAGVYWDGRVSACPCQDYDASPQLYLGDLTKQSLSEAFNSPQSQALWRAHESGQLPPVCRNCSRHGTLSELGPSHPLIRSPLDLIGG